MKNIQIRFKKDTVNTTVTVKECILNLYSNTFFNCNYSEKKKFINAQIKNLINPNTKNLSQEITKFLLKTIQEEINILKNK